MEQLAGAVGAELGGAVCAYELAFGINTVARAEFTHMQQELAAWEPLVRVRCMNALPPREAHAGSLCISTSYPVMSTFLWAQEIERKQEECGPLLTAIEGLEGRMEALETAIQTLDFDSKHLAAQLSTAGAESPSKP